jgi:hypothetical protein
VRHIWATEGIRGMYRGITLNLFKNPLAIGVSFVVNDLVKEVGMRVRASFIILLSSCIYSYLYLRVV